MKECVFFHSHIAQIFKTQWDKESNPALFLLLSVDDECIYWLIKLESENISDGFLNNLKFIIPYGVKIIGILKLGKIKDKEFNNMTIEIHSKIMKIEIEFDLEILTHNFYSIEILKPEENSNIISCIGLIYNKREEDDKLFLEDNFNKIKFLNLEKKFKSEFFIINSFINPLIIIKNDSFEINELYSSIIGINFRELNIMIPNLSDYLQRNDDNLERNKEKSSFIQKSQSKLENFLNYKVKLKLK
jgi:hypothetical protein